MSFNPNSYPGGFINTSIFFSEDESQRLYELTQFFTDIANLVNTKQFGQYTLNEVITGQQFSTPGNNNVNKFPFRQVYYIGPIASGATLTTPHNITGLVQFTNIYGTVITDAVDYRPLPRVSTVNVNQQISLDCDATNFIIVNGAGGPNITSGIVILEYLKN